ncbi:uncharacterized protein TRIVIDRAFT_61353 [Trichoderma virens Gv29-8]|uniref:Uncharacterized protein n=1 Tax=Hypocrea virens (strain Gv29-8 / FGSC 10586) TaxID=413071 RepID=G9MMJ9_HYPVG|nr:uncharacterized protein TRIVIDRAFT_61353 [Trichoderma virens Gv29-8]EHK24567.1 hypothetical protein TRIVIDRAFT_61353 [Trichoderma virens Gv29-8]
MRVGQQQRYFSVHMIRFGVKEGVHRFSPLYLPSSSTYKKQVENAQRRYHLLLRSPSSGEACVIAVVQPFDAFSSSLPSSSATVKRWTLRPMQLSGSNGNTMTTANNLAEWRCAKAQSNTAGDSG